MALALDPSSNYRKGIIRCITSRSGDVQVKGYVDQSELHKVTSKSFEPFVVGEQLQIKNTKEILDKLIE